MSCPNTRAIRKAKKPAALLRAGLSATIPGLRVTMKVRQPILGKKHVFGSLQAMADYYGPRLTREGAQDGIIVPAGDVVHVLRFAVVGPADDEQIAARYGVATLANFKQFIECLPVDDNIACVNVVMCRDSEASVVLDLVEWLNGRCKEKDFLLTALMSSEPRVTAEAVSAVREMFNVTQH